MLLYGAIAACVLIVLLARWKAADIYDIVIIHMTERWYSEVLGRLPKGNKVLDVGIGTGTALCMPANAAIIKAKALKFVGVDYEARYITKAAAVAAKAGLSDVLQVRCASIYDDALPKELGRDFDVAYFSGSISLMPDPPAALQAAAAMLKPSGTIYITQTFQRRNVPGLSIFKPMIKYLTTIDFGQLVFEPEVVRIVEAAQMEVIENVIIPNSVDNAMQVARLLVVKPKVTRRSKSPSKK